VLEPLKKTKHWECEEYQPLLLIAILMITKSMGCTFPVSILTSETDSSPQTVLKMDANTAWKRLDISLSLHGVTPQKREVIKLVVSVCSEKLTNHERGNILRITVARTRACV